jgi:DNA-binding transcriptional regulator LsrR (DeoR family)
LLNIEEEKFIIKISRLYYIEGLTQQNIADKLKISRTKVSRYLTRAKESGIVEIAINHPPEDFSKMEYEIEKKYRIRECIIVDTLENDEEIIRSMGVRVNSLLERLLDDGSYIGIGWGYSLRELSKHINIINKSDIKVVPMIGGLGRTGTGVHTNSVAKRIADGVGGTSYMIHSPAVMDSSEAKQMMEKDSNVREIMNMSKKIDTALIGLSDLSNESTLIKTGSFSKDDFRYLRSLKVVGDVNLVFIDREGRHVTNDIDERIVRVPLERLKKIKNVISVAFGKRKLEVITAALRGNIINILLTDKDTAKYISGVE